MKKMANRLGLLAVLLASSASVVAHGQTKISFKKTQIDPVFRSEGVAVADFNGDGKKDIAAGSVYYTAGEWRMHSILEEPNAFEPKTYSDAFCCFAEDLSGDGLADLVVVGFPGKETPWFENPGSDKPWKRHVAVKVTNNESPLWSDLTGDGRPELVCGTSPDVDKPDGPRRRMAFSHPGKDPRALWRLRTFSAMDGPGSKKYAHGIGVGDINGDGRADVVIPEGWWEAPENKKQPEWTFHAVNLGEHAAHMHVYDFDGDGDNDVLSTSAHRFGVWWHEQTPDGFTTHTIDDTLSQTHAVCLVDINGDGLKDFVTGKRWWAHMGKDPGSDQPALVVWYELSRKDGRPQWTRHQIDDDSGVGTQFEVADVNGDGLLDVVTSNKKGVYYFEQSRD